MESKDKLSALKNDFDVWRSNREKGTPVPNALKERACQLLEHYKISHIARSCNVSATLVKTWKKILNQDDPKNNPKSVTFMELSNLGRATKYLLSHKEGLMQFCYTKGAKLDNNKMEAMLKLIVIGRKNHYFFKSSVGAAVSDTILSVIATAKGTGINIFEYLTHLQRFSKEVRKNPDLWTPWNYLTTLENIQKSDVLLKAA